MPRARRAPESGYPRAASPSPTSCDSSDVSVRGAGPWYSELAGRDDHGGLYAMGTGVTIADLMIAGDVRHRNDAQFDSGVEGNFGQGSLVQNVWIAHTKTGVWVDAGTDGLLVTGVRVRDTFADGVHLHGRVSDARVEHASVRNTGDDAMAMWSPAARSRAACSPTARCRARCSATARRSTAATRTASRSRSSPTR